MACSDPVARQRPSSWLSASAAGAGCRASPAAGIHTSRRAVPIVDDGVFPWLSGSRSGRKPPAHSASRID